jgi:hypothetical protein
MSGPDADGAAASARRAAVWRDLSRLLERVVSGGERGSFLDECLDTLVEQFGAQRALVLQSAPGGGAAAVGVAARGPRRNLGALEREEISRTIVRRALDENR